MIVSDDWRSWIAENLVLRNSPESLVSSMVAKGISKADALSEIEVARQSPYLRGTELAAQRMQNRMTKCAWFLEIQRNLDHQSGQTKEIDRRHHLSREAFYREYYFANKPVVISGMLEEWPALSKWNLSFFKENHGARIVDVQSGRDSNPDYEIEQNDLHSTMLFSQYIELIEAATASNDFYMTANNTSHNREALSELWKDVGRIPEYLDPDSRDDGFLWIGPAGTRTPFHHDLTNNFIAQVLGSKRVKLVAPCESGYIYNHLHCYSQVDGSAIDYDRFPLMRDVPVAECELGAGEILFLPVGWWHYVEGLSQSVSMSFINFLYPNNASSFYSTYGPI
jgi:hypothetical protein